MSFKQGEKITLYDFKELKNQVKTLMQKRSFGNRPLNNHIPEIKDEIKFTATDANSVYNPYQYMRSTNGSYSDKFKSEQSKMEASYFSDESSIVNKYSDFETYHNNTELVNPATNGCGGACAGLCVTICANGCRSECLGYCSSACAVGCSGECKSTCIDQCIGCKVNCDIECANDCMGCGSSCLGVEGGSTLPCTACNGSCYNNAVGTCTNCDGSCTASASYGCGKCLSQCGAATCESKCSITCIGVCTSTCSDECKNNCGGFCTGGCSGQLQQGNWECSLPVKFFTEMKIFTESQSWTIPNGIKTIYVFSVGGGGGAANAYSNYFEIEGTGEMEYNCTSGAGGGFTTYNKLTVVPGQTLIILVGAGGGRGKMNYKKHADNYASDGGTSILSLSNGTILAVSKGGYASDKSGSSTVGDAGDGGSGGGDDWESGGTNGYSNGYSGKGQRELDIQTVIINNVTYNASTQGTTTCPFNNIPYGAGGGAGERIRWKGSDDEYQYHLWGGFGGNYGGGNGCGYVGDSGSRYNYERYSGIDGTGGGGGGAFAGKSSSDISWYNRYGVSGDGGNGCVIIAW